MKFFVDTANLDQIRAAFDLGFVSGVTTNPVLICREGTKELEKHIRSIREVCDGEIFSQVITKTTDEMVRQAQLIASWDNNITVKLPATIEGIRAMSQVSKQGIRTCATLVFNTTQAMAAALAGAAYVAPFVNRSNAIGLNGLNMVQDIAAIYHIQNIDTQIVGASIDSPQDFTEMALAGAQVVTGPLRVLQNLVNNRASEATLEEFLTNWTGTEF